MLSDGTIKSLLATGGIGLSSCGPEIENIQFQPASVDLRLNQRFTRRGRMGDFPLALGWGEGIIIPPGACLLASTVETIKLPDNIIAIVDGRSTWGRQFLVVHSTAGYIDPGFNGEITLEISNIGEQNVRICPGDRICQVRFFRLDGPAQRPYGHPELNSHYQGQTGPTLPKIEGNL